MADFVLVHGAWHGAWCWKRILPGLWAAGHRAFAVTGRIPPADPAVFGLTGDDAAWLERRQTPHPGGVYDEPLQFDPARVAALPRTFIDCTAPALPTIAAMRERVRQEPGWQVLEIVTGHDAMISAPRALLDA